MADACAGSWPGEKCKSIRRCYRRHAMMYFWPFRPPASADRGVDDRQKGDWWTKSESLPRGTMLEGCKLTGDRCSTTRCEWPAADLYPDLLCSEHHAER